MKATYIFLILGLYIPYVQSKIESETMCTQSNGDVCSEKGVILFEKLNEYTFLRFKESFGGNYISYSFTSNKLFDVLLMDEFNYKTYFTKNKGIVNTFQDYSQLDTLDFSVEVEDNMSKPVLKAGTWYYLVIRNKALTTNTIHYSIDMNLYETFWIIILCILCIVFIAGVLVLHRWINKR
jgi:hypothetical protein